ncbi:MAG: hypothetical protein V4479_09345 [Actinomycetota bacterium]
MPSSSLATFSPWYESLSIVAIIFGFVVLALAVSYLTLRHRARSRPTRR